MHDFWFDRMIFIPGVAKSGTTTLFEMLSRHPEIAPCRLKEPLFFNQDHEIVSQHKDWYGSQFPAAGVPMEASSLYLYSETAIAQILCHVKRPKFIIILRDPAVRAFSAYQHMANQNPVRDKRSFDELIKAFAGNTFAIETEQNLCQRAVRAGLIDESYFGADYHARHYRAPFVSRFSNPLAWFAYFTSSSYHLYVLPLLEKYRLDFHIVFLENLVTSPKHTMDKILGFLELEKDQRAYRPIARNRSAVPKAGVITDLRQKFPAHRILGRPLKEILDDMGMHSLGDALKSLFYKPGLPMTAIHYRQARALLQQEYEFWSKRNPELVSLWSSDQKSQST